MSLDCFKALSEPVIRRLADDQSWQRGHDYLHNGQVISIESTEAGIVAIVRGSQDYTITLSADDGVLDYTCNCPQGTGGSFCRHCVAAALAWLRKDIAGGRPKPRPRAAVKKMTVAGAAKILQDEDKETLLKLILEWANDDDRLRERLLLYAARRSSPESGIAAAARAFERAVRIRGFLQYREAGAWAREVDDAIDNFVQLLQDRQAVPTIELCESALEKLVNSSESIDDSDGHLTDLRDRLEDLHFQACQEARPDPVALAKRLFDWELRGELDIFYGAAERYAEILGPTGLKKYRQLAQAEWAKVPARTSADKSNEWGEYFAITHIMESLARASGDAEELVAVMSRDLSNAYDYLEIAQVYRQAGQHDRALEWAEKGLSTFPERTDSRLREFAADEYHRCGRHEEAMALIWSEFSEQPQLATWLRLQHHATGAGSWPAWRERALAEVRARIAKAGQEGRGPVKYSWMRPSFIDRSLLVEIFLAERDLNAAWQEAQSGGCSDSLWLTLADKREEDHPAEAAPIYMKYAEARIAATRNSRYEDGVELLIKCAAAMKRMGQTADFERKLEALRTAYKIKRNFIKLVDQNRKLLYLS